MGKSTVPPSPLFLPLSLRFQGPLRCTNFRHTWYSLTVLACLFSGLLSCRALPPSAATSGNLDSSGETTEAFDAWPSFDDISPGSNLLLVLSDTHRQDHAAPLRRGWSHTPHLELLANQGVRFTDTMTPIPISAPAYASLFTGLAPPDHGLLNNQQDLTRDLPLLAESLQSLGYETAAIIGNPFCSSEHGFDRGFDHVWDAVEGQGKAGNRLTDEALQWLEHRDPERPFFLFIAYMDAHTPYVTPSTPPSLWIEIDGRPWGTLVAEDAHREHHFDLKVRPGTQRWHLTSLDAEGRAVQTPERLSSLFMVDLRSDDPRLSLQTRGLEPVADNPRYRQLAHQVEIDVHNPTSTTLDSRLRFRIYRRYQEEETPALYAAGVRQVDHQVGRLMGYLHAAGLESSTTVTFVSDHGEMLGEHGAWGHIDQLWQETLRVPLIVKGPGLPSGVEYSDPFDLLDLHHLVRRLAGDPPRESSETFPFVGPSTERLRFAFTFPPEAPQLQVALRSGSLKLVLRQDDSLSLFDLALDPTESEDVLDARRGDPLVRELISLAKEQIAKMAQVEPLDLQSLSPQEIDRLKALGYLD